jgi:hypothetical protein
METRGHRKIFCGGKYDESIPWNPVEKIIMERRSIRAFKEEPFPDSMNSSREEYH